MLLNFCWLFFCLRKRKENKYLVVAQVFKLLGGDRAFSYPRVPWAPFCVVDFFKGPSHSRFKNRLIFLFLQVVLLSWVHCSGFLSLLWQLFFFLSRIPLSTSAVWLLLYGGRGWEGTQGVGEEICQCTFWLLFFLSKKFIGLFLDRVKMFPYQNSHFKAATSRCSWHQNDCVKAVCQQIGYNKTACIKMAVSCIGTGLAIKGVLSRMSVLFIAS